MLEVVILYKIMLNKKIWKNFEKVCEIVWYFWLGWSIISLGLGAEKFWHPISEI